MDEGFLGFSKLRTFSIRLVDKISYWLFTTLNARGILVILLQIYSVVTFIAN